MRKEKKRMSKKEGKKGAHIFTLLKNMSATPTSLLFKKRPSLLILRVALKREDNYFF